MQENIDIIDETKIPLRRVLGVFTAILLVAGNMIGTGVFKKIVPMAATGLNEKYILLAWIVAGFITILGAFAFAGLAKLTIASGGAYEYLRICYGNFVAYLLGWTIFVIVGSGALAAVGFIFSQSVNSLIAIPEPLHQWSTISIAHSVYPFAFSGVKIFAVITIALLTWFNSRGVKKVSVLNNIITSAKILGILFLILTGFILISPSIHKPEMIAPIHNLSGISFISIFFGAMLSAFWAYDGFTNVASVTGEIKNPKKNVPIAIIMGVSIVMVLYVMVNAAFMRTLSLTQLASLSENKIAASEMAGIILGSKGRILISLLIMISSFGTLNVLILVYSRLYYRMAQENVFFKSAARVHPIYRTPYNALLYSMIWSCMLVMSGTFDVLTNMSVFSSFAFHTLEAFGLIKMKRKKVITEKIPAYPLAPVLFILLTLIFLVNTFISNPAQSITGITLTLIGIPFYYFFKNRYSNTSNPDSIKT
jgi:basic amino acid/polyamine antiporter, APA family